MSFVLGLIIGVVIGDICTVFCMALVSAGKER